jgi:hypothetical protein
VPCRCDTRARDHAAARARCGACDGIVSVVANIDKRTECACCNSSYDDNECCDSSRDNNHSRHKHEHCHHINVIASSSTQRTNHHHHHHHHNNIIIIISTRYTRRQTQAHTPHIAHSQRRRSSSGSSGE